MCHDVGLAVVEQIHRRDTADQPHHGRLPTTPIGSRSGGPQVLGHGPRIPSDPERAGPRGVHDLSPRRPDTASSSSRFPTTKPVKNRIHFDLRPAAGTRDEEVERI